MYDGEIEYIPEYILILYRYPLGYFAFAPTINKN